MFLQKDQLRIGKYFWFSSTSTLKELNFWIWLQENEVRSKPEKEVSFKQSFAYETKSTRFGRGKALLVKNILRVIRHPGWATIHSFRKRFSLDKFWPSNWLFFFFFSFSFQGLRFYVYSSRFRNNNFFHDGRWKSSKSQVWDRERGHGKFYELRRLRVENAHWRGIHRHRLFV